MAHIIIILPKVWMILHLKYKVQHARENSLLASAKQKALVTRLVKEGPGKMNLAIGDGAYDVGMIQEANIADVFYKLRAVNSLLSVEYLHSIPLVSRAPTIIFGMDVSHGSPGRSDVPSIACCFIELNTKRQPTPTRGRPHVANEPGLAWI
ncbi:argonaute 4A-like protein [Tanacetum coccineum]